MCHVVSTARLVLVAVTTLRVDGQFSSQPGTRPDIADGPYHPTASRPIFVKRIYFILKSTPENAPVSPSIHDLQHQNVCFLPGPPTFHPSAAPPALRKHLVLVCISEDDYLPKGGLNGHESNPSSIRCLLRNGGDGIGHLSTSYSLCKAQAPKRLTICEPKVMCGVRNVCIHYYLRGKQPNITHKAFGRVFGSGWRWFGCKMRLYG